MKTIILILLITILISCTSRRDGCGTENYKHRFRVEKIYPNKLGGYTVSLWNYQVGRRYVVCCSLPDSVKTGNYITL